MILSTILSTVLSAGLAELGDSLLATAVSNTLVASGIAALAVLVTRLRLNPSIAHGLWVLVLVKLITPPLFEVHVPVPGFGAASGRISRDLDGDRAPASIDLTGMFHNRKEPSPGDGATGIHPSAERAGARNGGAPEAESAVAGFRSREGAADDEATAPLSFTGLALLLWALGACTALGAALYRAARFHRGLRFAPHASGDVRREARQLSRRLGIRRTPAIRVLPGKLSPMLWGFLGPAQVLLPEVLEKNLTPDQKRTLLAHELAHLHRRDHWVRVLEMLVRAVHWWNPLVFWACRQLRNAEEECCDAWVVWALPEASRTYADALLDTVEFLSDAPDVPAHASGIGKVNNLKRRLIMIMQGDNRRTPGHLGRAAILGLATLTLPLVPAFGQVEELDVRAQLESVDETQDKSLNKKAVVAALQRAMELLARDDREKDVAVLGALLRKVQRSRPAERNSIDVARADRDAARTDIQSRMDLLLDRARNAQEQGRVEEAQEMQHQLQKLHAEADRLQVESQRLSEHARAIAEERAARMRGDADRAKQDRAQRDRAQRDRVRDRRDGNYQEVRARYEELAARERDLARRTAERDLAAERGLNRAQEVYNRTFNEQGNSRVRRLEEKVERLTNAVERLLQARDQDAQRRDRRSRGREEEIEEEEKEEEIEAEEILEKKAKKIREGEKRKNRGSRRGR